MDTRTYMHLLVVCVWCFLNAGGLLMVVSAQPAVNVWIVTPEADRKEGAQVEMRCVATNLESDHIVEWAIEHPEMPEKQKTLRWNVSTVTTNQRFEYETTHSGTGQTTQVFTITDLQKDDTDEFTCNVQERISTGGNIIVANSSVMLSVLYFPNESFPICSPDGSIAVDNGTELTLQCSSEAGNPTVMMDVRENISRCKTYNWTMSKVNDMIITSLAVDMLDDYVTFECVISSMYYPGMNRSCIIGPISVNGVTESVMECTPEPPTATSPMSNNSESIAGASAGGAAAVVLIPVLVLMFILIYRRRRGRNTKESCSKPTSQLDPSQPLDPIGLEGQDDSVIPDSSAYVKMNLEPDSRKELPRMTVDPSPPVYAKPKVAGKPNNSKEEALIPYRSVHDTTEQSYINPVFSSDVAYDTPRSHETNTTPSQALKPVAMISPTKIPKKPPPYKPKANRASDPLTNNPNQLGMSSSRPTSTPSSLPTHPEDITVTSAQDDGNTQSSQATLPIYAQVTKPNNQTNMETSGDGIVYADLDLHSLSSDDDNVHAHTDPTVYASVGGNNFE